MHVIVLFELWICDSGSGTCVSWCLFMVGGTPISLGVSDDHPWRSIHILYEFIHGVPISRYLTSSNTPTAGQPPLPVPKNPSGTVLMLLPWYHGLPGRGKGQVRIRNPRAGTIDQQDER